MSTFQCKRCGTEFGAKHHLKQHYQRHIVCDPLVSSKTYAELLEDDFGKVEKPFKCRHCDKSFTQQSNRSRHEGSCDNKHIQIAHNTSFNTLNNTLLDEITTLRVELQIKNKELKLLYDENKTLRDEIKRVSQEGGTSQIPKKKKKLSYATRVSCWNKYVGMTVGETLCLCCKFNTITQMNWECGHIVAESCGGSNDIENLRPICRHCNNDMGAENMREFALRHFKREIA